MSTTNTKLETSSVKSLSREELQTLHKLFRAFYLEKRDDKSCHSIFAIITALKAIEVELALSDEAAEADDNDETT